MAISVPVNILPLLLTLPDFGLLSRCLTKKMAPLILSLQFLTVRSLMADLLDQGLKTLADKRTVASDLNEGRKKNGPFRGPAIVFRLLR